MPIEVDVQGFGVIEFPDGTSEAQILEAIKTEVPKVKRQKLDAERDFLRTERRVTDLQEQGLTALERALEPLTPSGLLNQPARIHKAITGADYPDPFQPGKAAIKEIPEPEGTGVLAGVGKFGARLLNALQSPESLITLPAAPVSLPMRTLFAADIARHLPEQVARSAATLGDIESTTAEKTAAILEPLASIGMEGLLLRTPRTPGMMESSPSTSAEVAGMLERSIADTPLSDRGFYRDYIRFGSPATELPPAPTPRPKVKPVVPGTAAEVGKDVNVLQEIRSKDARTIRQIQELFPGSKLSREGARALRDQAWTKEELSKAADEGDTPPPAEPPVEPTPPPEPPAPAAPAVEPAPDTGVVWDEGMAAPKTVVEGQEITLSPSEKALIERNQKLLSETEPSKPTAPPAEPPPAAPASAPASPAAPGQSVTGIKNAVVDRERVARGLPPAMEPSRRSFGEVWTLAMRKIDSDPAYPDRLISDLADRPRAITDLEDASLLHRQVELQNEYYNVAKELTDATDVGNAAAATDAGSRLSDVSDKLLTLYNVNKAAGTETGRGLNARKMLVDENFTLTKMELDRRISKGGKQLTPDERAEVIRLQKKIEQTQRAYNAYRAKAERRIADAEALNNPRIKPLVERILKAIEDEAVAARKRISERGITFGSGPLHELPNIRDYAIIGASKIARGAYDFSKWSAEMVKEFGSKITPHLQSIFDESGRYLDESANAIGAPPADAPKVKTALAGKPAKVKPTKQEEQLVFEADKAKQEWAKVIFDQEMRNRSALQKGVAGAAEALNLSRAVMTSFDLSAVLRQGGFIAVAHPIRAARSLPAMFKAFASEAGAHAINQQILNRPNYPLYQRSRLYLAEHGHALSKMEEAFRSRLAERIPGVAHSQRAYTTFLNKLRADSFDAMAKSLTKDGTLTPEQGNAIANFINVATGRGATPGSWEGALNGLNTVFFAPRYVTSRFQLLAGQPLYRGTAATRKLIAGEYMRYLIGVGVIYGLTKLALGDDATIETDPRSSDAGKIKVGNTRIDPLSGLQQGTVAASKLWTGERKTLKDGTIVPQGRWETVGDFLRSKLAPVPGGTLTAGQIMLADKASEMPPPQYPQTLPEVAVNMTVPMTFGDIYDALKEQGIDEGTAMGLLSIFGAGVQTFGGTNQNFEKDLLNLLGVDTKPKFQRKQ